MVKRGLVFMALLASSAAWAASSECEPFIGARIISAEGDYLGRLSNKYDSDSVFNKYGTYGSKYNSESIWNKYGKFGSEYNSLSPFNKYSSSAPYLVQGRKAIARLTKNKHLAGAVDPMVLAVLCFEYEPD